MKPSDEFATIVAGVVSANTFQLLNSSGGIIAELGTSIAVGSNYNALRLIHLDSTVGMVDSELAWSRVPPAAVGSPVLLLIGPKAITAPATAPFVQLQQTVGSNDSRTTISSGTSSTGATPARISLSSVAATATTRLEGDAINVAPTTTGRLQMGGRTGFLPLSTSYDLRHTPAQFVTTTRTVLGGCSQAIDVVAGDALWLLLTIPVRRRLVVGPAAERCRLYLYAAGVLLEQTAIVAPTIETVQTVHLAIAYTAAATANVTFDARIDSASVSNDYTTETPGGSLLIHHWGIR